MEGPAFPSFESSFEDEEPRDWEDPRVFPLPEARAPGPRDTLAPDEDREGCGPRAAAERALTPSAEPAPPDEPSPPPPARELLPPESRAPRPPVPNLLLRAFN